MAIQTITPIGQYKGHSIEKVEQWLQVFFIVDHNFDVACWSMADAKRLIRGESLVYETVKIQKCAL